jgi:hypothetical protein
MKYVLRRLWMWIVLSERQRESIHIRMPITILSRQEKRMIGDSAVCRARKQ